MSETTKTYIAFRKMWVLEFCQGLGLGLDLELLSLEVRFVLYIFCQWSIVLLF